MLPKCSKENDYQSLLVHECVILDVCVHFIHGPVGLSLGLVVDEVVLHELVALDHPLGFLRRHHLDNLTVVVVKE